MTKIMKRKKEVEKNKVTQIRLQIGNVAYIPIIITKDDHWPPQVTLHRFKTELNVGLTGFAVMPKEQIAVSIDGKPAKMFVFEEPIEITGIKSDGSLVVRKLEAKTIP